MKGRQHKSKESKPQANQNLKQKDPNHETKTNRRSGGKKKKGKGKKKKKENTRGKKNNCNSQNLESRGTRGNGVGDKDKVTTNATNLTTNFAMAKTLFICTGMVQLSDTTKNGVCNVFYAYNYQYRKKV